MRKTGTLESQNAFLRVTVVENQHNKDTGTIMRGYQRIFIAAALAALIAVPVAAQDELRYFPSDSIILIDVDFRNVIGLFPAEMVDAWRADSIAKTGFDFTERLDSMMIAMSETVMSGDPGDFYGIMKGTFNLDEVRQAIVKSGNEVVETNIAGMTAIRSNQETGQDYYVASAGPGMLVFGTENSLAKFQAVNSGAAGNAASNAMLAAAVADAGPDGFLRVSGYFNEQMKGMMEAQMPSMGSLNTFSVVADYANEFLGFKMILSGDDAGALEQVKMMMDSQLPMFAQMDNSGALQEIVNNLSSEVVGNKLTVTTGLSKATVDALVEQFGGMMNVAMPQ